MSKFYDLKQVADVLGISVKALRIRVSKGKMPNADKRVGDNLFWAEETLSKAKISVGETARVEIHIATASTPATKSRFDINNLTKTSQVVPL